MMYQRLVMFALLGLSQFGANAQANAAIMYQETAEGCICTQEYSPVCGSDLVTYGNDCMAVCEGVESWTDGECSVKKEQPKQARREARKGRRRSLRNLFNFIFKGCMCPLVYTPVCGGDGITYSNECSARCEGVDSWTDGKCPEEGCLCTLDYTPVCGEDGITYSNECSARCKGVESWTDGECSEKGCACTKEWRPVCGEDGVTYGNKCQAKCEGVTWTRGECKKECLCTAEYDPVCGEDNQTYSNDCVARCHVSNWTEGPCTSAD